MIGRGGLAFALALALGCTSHAPPAAPTLTGRSKQFAPLAIRDDAKLPGQAVILGTDGGIGSTVLALPAQPARVTVDAMTASGVLAIQLVAAPSLPGAPAASLMRGLLVGNPRWNAALWAAAQAAADALGKDLADLSFAATPRGAPDRVDAPALLAAGFLASLTGEAIDPAATLTGGLAPDGTIGPIDGVIEQVSAALARGKTRIGVPSGMRSARGANGQIVDLAQLARARRAELVELATLHDAYRLLTRKPLPAPVAVDERDMALDAEALRRFDDAYASWQQRIASEWAALLQREQAGPLPQPLRAMLRAAKERASEGERLRRAGLPHLAYHRIANAWLLATSVNRTTSVLDALAAGKPDAARAALNALPGNDASIAQMLAQIGALRPTTLAGHLAMVAGFGGALLAWSDDSAATAALGALPDPPAPGTGDALVRAIAQRLVVPAELEVASHALALIRDRGPRYTGAPASLVRVTAAIHAAVGARFAVLDAIGAPGADAAPREQARRALALRNRTPALVSQLAGVPSEGAPRDVAAAWAAAPDGELAASLLALAAHREALRDAAASTARYDALAVCGDLTANQPCDALTPWIAAAARVARAEARAARIATGDIPLGAKLSYQLAVGRPATDLAGQLDALDDLWWSTATSRIAIVLARNNG